MRKLKSCLGLAILSICIISCASTKVSTEKVFSDEKELIASGNALDYKIEKQLKNENLSENSSQVSVEYSETPVPANVYKLSLKNGSYNFTLKSIPTGLMSANEEKKSAMIPEVLLYDENFNLVENENLKGNAVPPSTFEPFLLMVTTQWNIAETGTYYLVVKADMSSEQGLTLEVFYNNRVATHTALHNFRRVPYGKYKLLI
ncbi:hypothetical protein [uncultured Treponema sp.]|uniref:hypothetical protein n=1 Tax=uncultured Treponema sp. TaxID=162155 RepID=UPI0025E47021|nr:hypothetical protein [uncultured Treponema sp.]